MQLKRTLANLLLHRLFLSEPPLNITPQKKQAFDDLIIELMKKQGNSEIDYTLPYSKHEFLRYLIRQGDILLHGSNNPGIAELSPENQTDWNGNQMEAVFATSDGIWPIFFATVRHKGYRGSFRNGCFVVEDSEKMEKRFYFFSLNEEFKESNPWQEGMIYILPGANFSQISKGLIRFDEWTSPSAVKPIAKMKVSPNDFPFLNNVSWHNEKEKMVLTWLKFKSRQK